MIIETVPEKTVTLQTEKDFQHSQLSFTKPLTLGFRHAEENGVTEKAKSILDSVPSYLARYRIKGRGPCSACEGIAEAPHNGGSKCKKRATLVSKVRLQPVINFVTNIYRKVNLFTSGF